VCAQRSRGGGVCTSSGGRQLNAERRREGGRWEVVVCVLVFVLLAAILVWAGAAPRASVLGGVDPSQPEHLRHCTIDALCHHADITNVLPRSWLRRAILCHGVAGVGVAVCLEDNEGVRAQIPCRISLIETVEPVPVAAFTGIDDENGHWIMDISSTFDPRISPYRECLDSFHCFHSFHGPTVRLQF
jgi:hypothetical protein